MKKSSVFCSLGIVLVIFVWLGLVPLNALPSSENSAVQARLVCASQQVKPGGKLLAGLLLTIPPEHHIYGREAGTMGLPTTIDWQIPADKLSLGRLLWPAPQEANIFGEKLLAYSGTVILAQEFVVSPSLKAGEKLKISAKVGWLECSDTNCIPGEAIVETQVNVVGSDAEPSPTADSVLFAQLETNSASSSAPQASSSQLFSDSNDTLPLSQITVVLCLAFMGGFILNFMPCVFPVLSLKVLSFMEAAEAVRSGKESTSGTVPAASFRISGAVKHSLWFALGVLLAFWGMELLMLIFKALGHELGWGFQMQSPPFVACSALLFWLIALNLGGMFEFGLGFTRLGQIEAGDGSFSKILGAVLSGFVAVWAATPCTAPFMGTALGYSLSAPVYVSFGIFTALALGMAWPYVALASWPKLLEKLPRPGRWMENFKQFLAFPLSITSVYFIWIFAKQAGNDGAALLLVAAVLTALAAWIYGKWGVTAPKKAWALVIFVGLLVLLTLRWACSFTATSVPSAGVQAWSPETVQSALAEGHPVFIDFGADWCLTCQVNEKTVLNTQEVQELFKKHNVVVLKADWTNKNEQITRELRKYGRSGVPLYVYYDPANPSVPQILPELLTPGLLRALFEH